MKSICMSCKFFKIEDALSGYCRVATKKSGENNMHKPMVRCDDTCQKWVDCGQQYYIRKGWVKALNTEKGNTL